MDIFGFCASICDSLTSVLQEPLYLSIVLFVLSGHLLNESRMSQRFSDLFSMLFGWLPGPLLVVNTLLNAFFGSLCGSASAAAAAIGSMLTPREEERGYAPALCAANNAASSPAGLLIPPSSALITYSIASGGYSIAALFVAGYLPGMIWVIMTLGAGLFMAVKHNREIPHHFDPVLARRSFKKCLPLLVLILIVAALLFGKQITINESAAISALGSLIIFFFSTTFSWRGLWNVFLESAKVSGSIIFLFATAGIIGWLIEYFKILETFFSWIEMLDLPLWVILFLINCILLIAGAFIDVTLAILLFTPLFLPIVTLLGMNPIHFGVMLVYNLCLGNITPPVGDTFFVALKVAGSRPLETVRTLGFYYAFLLVGLLLITYIPFFSMALPEALGLIG